MYCTSTYKYNIFHSSLNIPISFDTSSPAGPSLGLLSPAELTESIRVSRAVWENVVRVCVVANASTLIVQGIMTTVRRTLHEFSYILKAFGRKSDFLDVPKERKKNFLKFVTPFFAHGHIYLSKLVSTYRRRQSSVATPLPVRGQSCLVRIWLRGNN